MPAVLYTSAVNIVYCFILAYSVTVKVEASSTRLSMIMWLPATEANPMHYSNLEKSVHKF